MKKFSVGIIIFLICSSFLLGNANLVMAQGAATSNLSDGNNYESRLGECSIAGNGVGESFVSCLVWAFYYVILYPSAMFADLTGSLFDIFIHYSLDSASYGGVNGTFITQGWGVIRDIANVAFIFILLYIAIRHILQMGSSDTKRLLISLIIAALLINFSLFFSRVVIDAGNILARAFYNQITVTNDNQLNGTGVLTISQALTERVNPQQILGSELFRPTQALGAAPGVLTPGYAFFIMGFASFVNITLGMVFLSTFLLFIARVIGLWFMMIFSPIAFASLALPGGGSFLGQFGWNGWRDNILKLSFMAPIFLFFLFLLVMFLQIALAQQGVQEGQTTTQNLMAIAIPFIVIIVVLKQAKKIATDMSGEFGSALTSAVGKIAGVATGIAGAGIGAAAGATAFVARNTVGKSATRELNSGINQRNVSQYTKLAKKAEREGDSAKADEFRRKAKESANKVATLNKLSKSSFDVRRSEFLQKQVIGSRLGKLAGQGLQASTGAALGGQKLQLDVGKGKDTSRSKYEEGIKKKELETAKLYDVGSQAESRVSAIGYAAGRGIDGQTDALNHIDEYIKETQDDDLLDDEEKKDRIDEAEKWRYAIAEAKNDGDMKKVIAGGEIVTKDNTKVIKDLNDNISNWQKHIGSMGDPSTFSPAEQARYDDLTNEIKTAQNTLANTKEYETEKIAGTSSVTKNLAGEARNSYADVVEATRNNSWMQKLNMDYKPTTTPGLGSRIADQIRKGPVDDNKEMIKKMAKNMGLKPEDIASDDDSKKPPKTTPPPPSTPPAGSSSTP